MIKQTLITLSFIVAVGTAMTTPIIAVADTATAPAATAPNNATDNNADTNDDATDDMDDTTDDNSSDDGNVGNVAIPMVGEITQETTIIPTVSNCFSHLIKRAAIAALFC